MKDIDNNFILEVLAECISKLRYCTGMTLKEFSKLTGISMRTIGRMEHAKINPSYVIVATLVRALNISFDHAFYSCLYQPKYMGKFEPYTPSKDQYNRISYMQPKSFGECFSQFRNIDRGHLSSKSGVSQRTIRKIESEGMNPSFTNLYTLVRAIEISFNSIFYFDRPGPKSIQSFEHIVQIESEATKTFIYRLY